MKTKFSLILLFAFALTTILSGCGDDEERTNVQIAPYNGTDDVFRGLPFNGITVGLPSGAKLRPDDSQYSERAVSFSMTIAPNNQFVMVNGMKLVPSYWTYPAHPGALDFFAVSENEYSRGSSSNPFGGEAWTLGPWDRQRFALEGHGTVQDVGGRYYFQGELILYTIDAAVGFSFDTGTFGIRIGFGGDRPPQRIGTIGF
jgi:hypothetical protein